MLAVGQLQPLLSDDYSQDLPASAHTAVREHASRLSGLPGSDPGSYQWRSQDTQRGRQ